MCYICVSVVCDGLLTSMKIIQSVYEFVKQYAASVENSDDGLSEEMAGLPLPAWLSDGRELCDLLSSWGAPQELLVAALLLRPVTERWVTPAQVGAHFGPAIGHLTDDYSRIIHHSMPDWNGEIPEQMRVRSFVAAYHDRSLALLCAALLWLRVMHSLAGNERSRRLAGEEARRTLLPYLQMLGLMAVRRQVLKALNPADDLAEQLGPAAAQLGELRQRLPFAHVDSVENPQIHNFDASAQPVTVKGAAGGTVRPQVTLAVEILVETVEQCYLALRVVHEIFHPVEGGFFDTIGAPKANGHRSLRTMVVAVQNGAKQRAEVTITTRTFDAVNQWGLAALHFHNDPAAMVGEAWWLRDDWRSALAAGEPGSLPEQICVFSPDGEVFRFPRGASVVDYAYHVHSELADQVVRFRVNGREVEAPTAMHHWDLVELEHEANAPGPTRIWLNAATTARARSAIDRFLKRREQDSFHGQKILDRVRKALEDHYGFGLPAPKVEQMLLRTLRSQNLATRSDLLAEIAAGRLAAEQLLHPLFEEEIARQLQLPRELRLLSRQTRISQCCRPRPGDDIVGVPYRRHGELVNLRIHKRVCTQAQQAKERVDLKWRLRPPLATVVRIDLTALDDHGLLGRAVRLIYEQTPPVKLLRVEAVARQGQASLQFDVEAESGEVIKQLAQALRLLPDGMVSEVRVTDLLPSEQDALRAELPGEKYNPYTPLPVKEKEMLYGRGEELRHAVESLQGGHPSLWLIGQKRVGKTSLLLHLKEYLLPQYHFAPVFIDFQLLGNPAQSDIFYEVANAVCNELRADLRIGDAGAPIRSLFANDPATQLIHYLRTVQTQLGGRRLVLLIDEFSRTTDSYFAGQLDGGFFDRWRAMMHQTLRNQIGYVIVVQRAAMEMLEQRRHEDERKDDPVRKLMDVGTPLTVRPLGPDAARRLVEWPMRNYLEHSPQVVDQIIELTGGSPFLIQTFCHKLVAQMGAQHRRAIEPQDVDAVSASFMMPAEGAFVHLTDMLRGSGNLVAGHLAHLAAGRRSGRVTGDELQVALPQLPPDKLRTTLALLRTRDLLVEEEPGAWRFASSLFQQWLVHYPAV